MADSMQKTREEMARFLAALKRLAPDKTFGGITLAELEADAKMMDTKDEKVAGDQATLDASQDDRKGFFKVVDNKLEKLKNGVIGDPDFGPDSPLYGALGFVRDSERDSGLTRRRKDDKDNDDK